MVAINKKQGQENGTILKILLYISFHPARKRNILELNKIFYLESSLLFREMLCYWGKFPHIIVNITFESKIRFVSMNFGAYIHRPPLATFPWHTNKHNPQKL